MMQTMQATLPVLAPTDAPAQGTFEAIFKALEASSASIIGPARAQLLVIPIHDDAGMVAGGFWGTTLFQWLQVQLLIVPDALRGRGIGTILMLRAELEARRRGCCGAFVDTLSFQAAPFYQKLGFIPFGELPDFPPGHRRLYFCKRYDPLPAGQPAGAAAV
jgi:GNAT superfamily N-acetyltransferase